MNYVKSVFNKKFSFQKSSTWVVPENEHILTTPEFLCFELLQLKEHLNSVKSKLNVYPIEEWSMHTKKRNPAGEIQWKLRNTYNAEFVTQAWCKMFECLCSYDLVSLSPGDKEFNSLHLCEAPGAFIAALNHFLRTKHKDVRFNWIATTLNPYYEGNQVYNMILDDRLMLHTLANWHFGHDFTGNIMDMKNIESLRTECEKIKPVVLITADGSIDCFRTPEEQENKVAQLHIYEVLTALLILHCGGSFMLKMFTFFECSSINILYLLNLCFASVSVFKPATSKGGNSEVYVICMGYNRSNKFLDLVYLLLNKLENKVLFEKSIFRRQDVPDDFLEQVYNCARYFMHIQCSVIENNISTFHKPVAYHLVQKYKSSVTQHFLKEYQVEVIEENLKLVCGVIQYNSLNLNPRLHTGNYDERTRLLKDEEKLKFLQERCNHFQIYHWTEKDGFKILNICTKLNDFELLFKFGKPVSILGSSKFIFAPLLDMHKECLRICNNNALQKSNEIAWLNIHDFLKGEKFIWTVNDKIDFYMNYDEYEKKTFTKFLQFQLQPGQNIAVWNFPTYTLFSVGVLYLLANFYFERIVFVKYNCILFLNFRSCMEPYLKVILDCINKRKDDKSILSVVPISNICSGQFYSDVLMFNNANLMYESHILLYN